jgi:hypothetical protein
MSFVVSNVVWASRETVDAIVRAAAVRIPTAPGTARFEVHVDETVEPGFVYGSTYGDRWKMAERTVIAEIEAGKAIIVRGVHRPQASRPSAGWAYAFATAHEREYASAFDWPDKFRSRNK